MSSAAAGEPMGVHGDWIDHLDEGGRQSGLAVAAAIVMALLAVVLAVGMLHGAVNDVSTGFMTSGSTTPSPIASTVR